MSKLKLKTLLEGFAWERKADGSLPTLADTTAAHAAKMANEAVGQEDADARWNDPISNAMRHLTSRSKVSGTTGKAPRNFYAEKLAALKAQRKQLEFDMEQEAEPEGGPIADYYGDALNHIDQQIDAIRSKMTENVDEADVAESDNFKPKRWQDDDGDGKWYEPEDVNESAYKNATNNELASHIGQLTSELKAEKDRKKQEIIRKDLEACKSELKSRKQNESLTTRDLDLISKFKKNLNESARRY